MRGYRSSWTQLRATGSSWLRIAHLLDAQGEHVVLADGKRARELLRVHLERVKGLEEVGEVALKVAALP